MGGLAFTAHLTRIESLWMEVAMEGFYTGFAGGMVYGKGRNRTNGCVRTHDRQPHPLGRPSKLHENGETELSTSKHVLSSLCV